MGCWHFLVGLLLLTAASAFDRNSDCPELEKCGKVSIPYPFGIKKGCSGKGFKIVCNHTYKPPRPFRGDYEVVNISLEGHLTATAFVASECYNQTDRTYSSTSKMSLNEDGPLTFSNTRNKFTAVGCDTVAYIGGTSTFGSDYTSGCMSFCSDKESVIGGKCSGIGCCQTPVPAGAKSFYIEVSSRNDHSSVLDFNPCSFAFLIADDQFKFNRSDLSNGSQYSASYQGKDKKVPLVLDWAIGNESCERAKKNTTAYACKSLNSNCSDSTNGRGYLCNCIEGYQGNPYLQGGCKDINECEKDPNLCGAWKCENTEGSHYCMPPAPAPAPPAPPPPPSPLKQLIEVILGNLLKVESVLNLSFFQVGGLLSNSE